MEKAKKHQCERCGWWFEREHLNSYHGQKICDKCRRMIEQRRRGQ